MLFCLWQQDEESISHLTPEQQRQLAMIENMPYTIEKEQEDFELKSAEEKERILGTRAAFVVVDRFCYFSSVHDYCNWFSTNTLNTLILTFVHTDLFYLSRLYFHFFIRLYYILFVFNLWSLAVERLNGMPHYLFTRMHYWYAFLQPSVSSYSTHFCHFCNLLVLLNIQVYFGTSRAMYCILIASYQYILLSAFLHQ